MYKNLGVASFIIFAFVGTAIAESDTILITNVPAKAETVQVVTTKVDTVKVVESVGKEPASPSKKESSESQAAAKTGALKIQLGAFSVKENADTFYNTMKTQFGEVVYIENVAPYWKIGVGTYSTPKSALAARSTFISQGYHDAFITR